MLYFMIIETYLTPKVSVAEVASYSIPCGYTWGTGHTVTTRQITSVYHVRFTPSVTRLAYVTFSHGPCQVSDDMIVLHRLITQEIDTFFGLGLSLEYDTIAIQSCIHYYLIFAKMFLKFGWFRDPRTVVQINTQRLE